jgi:hypothetical protein
VVSRGFPLEGAAVSLGNGWIRFREPLAFFVSEYFYHFPPRLIGLAIPSAKERCEASHDKAWKIKPLGKLTSRPSRLKIAEEHKN